MFYQNLKFLKDMKIRSTILFLGVWVFLLACHSNLPVFSNIPKLTGGSAARLATSTAKIDSVLLSIDFEDGDGDLGLASGDTSAPYSETACPNDVNSLSCLPNEKVANKFRYNFFVTIKRQNSQGIFEAVVIPNNATFNARFPKLRDNDTEAPLSGNINNTLEIFYDFANSPFKTGDIVVFEVQIADRKLNLSNMITTNSVKLGLE